MRFFVLCLFLSFSSLATAQPFGIVMGQQVETLKAEKTDQEFTYRITPPKTHPEIERYLVTATPGQGVCAVGGISTDHSEDAFGIKVRNVAIDIRKQIDTVYGPSRIEDFLETGSIWRNANEWTTAIFKHERTYQFVWGKKAGPIISNNVVKISASVQAFDHSSTYLLILFVFKNYEACKAEMNGAASKAF